MNSLYLENSIIGSLFRFFSFLHMLVAGDERVRTELKAAFNIYLFRKRAVYIGDSLFLSVRPEVVKRCLCTFRTFSFCADKKKKYQKISSEPKFLISCESLMQS